MFGIFKSKYNLINSGLMKGMTDIHSHVLPGVDDGSPDINTSLSLLRYMESIGLREVWLTPHIMEDYPTLNKKLQQQFDVLKAAYSGPLNLRLSSEYMMDAAFTNKLDGEVLPLGSSHLLVETSYMYPPPGLLDILMNCCQFRSNHARVNTVIISCNRNLIWNHDAFIKKEIYRFHRIII